MCLLIARTAGSWKPSEEEFDNAWNRNPHGFGVAFVNGGTIQTLKTLSERDAWKMVLSLPDGPALMHWRFATHGEAVETNCHPFRCFGGKWVGAHNGILSRQECLPGRTDSESYLLTLRGKGPHVPSVESDIQRLGGGKIAFLSQRGEVRIANQGQGSWRFREVWQSNDDMDPPPDYWGFGGYSLRSKIARPSTKAAFQPLRCEFCGFHGQLWDCPETGYLCADCVEFKAEGGL